MRVHVGMLALARRYSRRIRVWKRWWGAFFVYGANKGVVGVYYIPEGARSWKEAKYVAPSIFDVIYRGISLTVE